MTAGARPGYKKNCEKSCNPDPFPAVINGSVETLWSRWLMNPMCPPWSRLRCGKMKKRRGPWCGISFLWSLKWCVRIARGALRKKTFAR